MAIGRPSGFEWSHSSGWTCCRWTGEIWKDNTYWQQWQRLPPPPHASFCFLCFFCQHCQCHHFVCIEVGVVTALNSLYLLLVTCMYRYGSRVGNNGWWFVRSMWAPEDRATQFAGAQSASKLAATTASTSRLHGSDNRWNRKWKDHSDTTGFFFIFSCRFIRSYKPVFLSKRTSLVHYKMSCLFADKDWNIFVVYVELQIVIQIVLITVINLVYRYLL